MIRNDLTAPSTTITAATLAGMGTVLLAELCLQFGLELRPTLVSAFTTFVMALVGYGVREKRFGWGEPDEHEDGGP